MKLYLELGYYDNIKEILYRELIKLLFNSFKLFV